MNEDENNTQTLQAAFVAAGQLARPIRIENIPHVIVPAGYELKNLERTMEEPIRGRGDFPVVTAEAFLRTVGLMWSPLERLHLPVFFARSGTTAKVQAVINFYDWRDHTVTLSQGLSDAFLDWYRLNTVAQPQRKFALFLEERTAHVVKPDGASLLELARKFKANVTVRFQSCVESENGDSALEYLQTTEAGSASAKQRMKVPQFITLCLPVWHGGEPVKFEARFSYGIGEDGKLSLSFEILGLNELLSVELRKIVASIAKELKGSVVIEGSNCPVPAL